LAQPGVKQVGMALETVLGLGNTVLLPIKLLNEKTKERFNHNMNKYREKLAHIPEEDIIDVPPEIGVPILDKFTYITNDYISDMFVTLLTNASSTKTIGLAHPSFLSIIDSLSFDEALIVKHLARRKASIPFIYYRYELDDPEGSFREWPECFTALEADLAFLYPENLQLYLDNLVRKGILLCERDRHVRQPGLYESIITYYEEKQITKGISQSWEPNGNFSVKQGVFTVTSFGSCFIDVCCSKEIVLIKQIE
jgi:hypothetical protein